MERVMVSDRWPLMMNPNRVEHGWWSFWEKARLAKAYDIVTSLDDPVVYEIGAEEGDFPALYGTWGARVVMIEPSPFSWPQIKAHWEANVDGLPAGWFVGLASNVDTWVRTDYDDRGLHGWPRCAYRPQRPEYGFRHIWEHSRNTNQRRLDTLISTLGWPKPDLVCVDVEGAAGFVLRGAVDMLTTTRPHLLVSIHYEAKRELYGTTADEAVHDYLKGYGYTGVHLEEAQEDHWWFQP